MDAQHATGRNRLLVGIAAVVVALAGGFAVVQLVTGDEAQEATTTSVDTTSPASTTSSSTAGRSTTTTFAPTADASPAVFPDVMASRRFDAPGAVAHAFATEVLGFVEPIVSDFARGDSRSGEVEIRASGAGDPTTLAIRQLEDDAWYVIGAAVPTIRLDSPAPGATLSSPLAIEGAAAAFEGLVNVRLVADGASDPIATTIVTAGGEGLLRGFSADLEFEVPEGAEHGALILYEASAEDGSTIAATVLRVHF